MDQSLGYSADRLDWKVDEAPLRSLLAYNLHLLLILYSYLIPLLGSSHFNTKQRQRLLIPEESKFNPTYLTLMQDINLPFLKYTEQFYMQPSTNFPSNKQQ